MKRNKRKHHTPATSYGKERHAWLRLFLAGGTMGLISMAALTLTANGQALEWIPMGGGIWNTANNNWDPAGPPPPTNWTNGDATSEAIFNGGGGGVTVAGGIDVNQISVQTDGYVFTGGTLNFIGAFPDIITAPATTVTFNSALAGVNGVDLNIGGIGPRTVIFNGANTYTGLTTVWEGILQASSSSALGAGGAGNGTSVMDGGTIEFNDGVDFATENFILNGTGVMPGKGALHFIGNSGETSLGGTITLQGGGPVLISAEGAGGSDDLDLNGNIDGSGQDLHFLIEPANANNVGIEIYGDIGVGVDDLVLLGGSTTGPGAASELRIYGTNTYTGVTRIEGGKLEINNGSAIADGSAVTLATTGPGTAPVLDVKDSETIGSLAGDAPSSVLLDSGSTLTTGGDNTSTEFAGTTSGAGGLTKDGSGSFTLSGASTYTGATNVLNGTMTIDNSFNGSGGLGGSTEIDIAFGATMTTTFAEAINDGAFVNVDGTLNLGGNETFDSLTGGAAGEVAIGNFDLTLTGGIDFAGRITGGTGGVAAGPGDLILRGDNTFTGNLTVLDDSTVTLIGSIEGDAQINTGGALVLVGPERIANSATVTNNGVFTIDGGEAVTTLNLNGLGVTGQGLLNGVGVVSATTYNLDNGATTDIGADLGLGTQNVGSISAGGEAVTQNGDSVAQDVNVEGAGTVFNLNGRLTKVGNTALGDNLTIGIGATMNLRLGGSQLTDQINDPARVINHGTMNLNGDEIVGSYASDGALGLTTPGGQNPSTLTAATYNLYDGVSTADGANLGEGVLNIGLDKLGNEVGGSVTLMGDSAADPVTVYGGINDTNFYLHGELTDVTNFTINLNGFTYLLANERINDEAVVNNNGWLSLRGVETIATLNSSGFLTGTGTLVANGNTINLTDGHISNVGANLQNLIGGNPQLTSNGEVTIDGAASTVHAANATINVGTADIQSGTMFLNGLFINNSTIDIRDEATLISGFADRINGDGAIVKIETDLDNVGNSGGTWTLGGDETIGTLNSGGLLDGLGLLTALDYDLYDGTYTGPDADLGTGDLDSWESVQLDGNTNADTIDINSGTLTTNGDVQNLGGVVTVHQGATWAVNGGYQDDTVRGTGTIRPGFNNGYEFRNEFNLRPGEILDEIGDITIDGDYVESGTLHGDLGPGGTFDNAADTVMVEDYASLTGDSVLRLNAVNGLDGGNVLCGERWNIIDSYQTRNGNFFNGYALSGAWSQISDADNPGGLGDTFGSRVLFDRGSGDVVALGLKAGETFADFVDIDANQLATIEAVFSGSVDPVGNYNSNDGGAGSVLDAIYTYGSPGDKDSWLGAIDALSPEAYAGAVDYALHATRSYAQNVMAATPQMSGANYDIVAGWSHMSLDSDASRNSGDYDLNSDGGYLGIRVNCHPDFVFGGFLAADSGDINGRRLDLDADGFVLGGFVEWTPQGEDGPWTIWSNLAYGSYEFNGDRQGLISRLEVPDFDGDAFQIGMGVDFEAYQDDCWTILPGTGLRYIDASTDGFTEHGGPDALKVDSMDQNLLLLETAVRFIYQQVGQPWALDGSVGWQHDFSDSDRDVDAALKSDPFNTFSVESPGLGDDAFTYGLGVYYDFGDRYRIGLSYRGEIRDDSDNFNSLDLRLTAGF